MRGAIRCLVFVLQLAIAAAAFFAASVFLSTNNGQSDPHDVRIDGNAAAPPHLEFACEQATGELQALFSNPELIEDLRQLHAGVSLALIDLSAGRADAVRKLNRSGIPVTAWLALSKEQGYYANAGNEADTAARFAAFEEWTRAYGLQWAGVGLDIEPNLQEFESAIQGHPWRLLAGLVRRYFDIGGVSRARSAYAGLIRRMQADGYRVDTYQFPFLADERAVHSGLLERLFGIVDVRGDREAMMTYTSFNHTIDSALIWEYGPSAQILTIGSTAGDPQAGGRFAPLNWDEFSRDLIVAGHFSQVVGVYSLEGCVRQGFVHRLSAMNWSQSITVPAEAQQKAIRLRARIQAALRTGSRLPYIAAALAILDGWLIWRRRRSERRRLG